MTENKSILIIDDSIDNLKLLKLVLSKEKYLIFTSLNGLDALTILNTHKINLIILDIGMPNMDGFEFLEKINSTGLFPLIPVIILSLHYESSYKARAFSLGVSDFINKPFDSLVLKNKIKTHLINSILK